MLSKEDFIANEQKDVKTCSVCSKPIQNDELFLFIPPNKYACWNCSQYLQNVADKVMGIKKPSKLETQYKTEHLTILTILSLLFVAASNVWIMHFLATHIK